MVDFRGIYNKKGLSSWQRDGPAQFMSRKTNIMKK
jgi:hypothetical protein